MDQKNKTIEERKVLISSEDNIIAVRRMIREAASEIGFGITDVTRIVTAASELVRNIYQHAGSGYVHYDKIEAEGKSGLELTFVDEGSGIPDLDLAFEEGYSTGKGLGMGLLGAKKMMDEMEIDTEIGKGTTIIIRKWMRQI